MSNLKIGKYGKVHRFNDVPVGTENGVSVLRAACGRYESSVQDLTDHYDQAKTAKCSFCFPEWQPPVNRPEWLESIYLGEK